MAATQVDVIMDPILEFDIAIIGGGMVGMSLASLLAARLCAAKKLRIAVIEAQIPEAGPEENFHSNFDARSTAISHGSADIFRELGLWSELQQHLTSIKQVHVSDQGYMGGAIIDAADTDLEALGYVVENAWLAKVLSAYVKTLENVHYFAPAYVTSTTPEVDGARLTIQMGAQSFSLKTSLMVIADGGHSLLRQALGIKSSTHDYRQTAIITNVEFSEAHKGVAYERFTANGPLALLPLGETMNAGRAALIWSLPTSEATSVIGLDDDDFIARLQEQFGFRVGRFTRVAQRYAYPLQMILAEEQIRSHTVLIGNTAHFLHPVAGQGFNLALRDCACLVGVLAQAVTAEQPLGALSVLQRYRDLQFKDQQLTIEFSHRLVQLFSDQSLSFIALRHLGFLSLEFFPLLKNHLSAQAMGTAGHNFGWRDNFSRMTADVKRIEPLTGSEPNLSAVPTALHLDQVYDLVIVGAGIVGAALACAVAQTDAAKNLRIAVVEAGGAPALYQGNQFDPRVVALSLASQQLLQQIHCWEEIVQGRVCAYQRMKVWDAEGTAAIDFDCSEVRQSQLGHIVENSVVVRALRQRIAQHPHITLISPVAVVALTQAPSARPMIELKLDNGLTISTPLVIAADGIHSVVRQLAGFSTREWDYGQQAIITNIRTERPHDYTAWQCFSHTGPLAFLPLQHQGDAHWCSIVWSADNSLAEQLMQLNEEQFCARVGAAFEYRLGAVKHCTERLAIPLHQRHASTYIQPGIALIGDAAHSIHPLAGQGVNLGLADVVALAGEIERALVRGIPLADYSVLRRYQRDRLAANLGAMSVMEGFKQLFSSRSLGVNWLRNTGMRQLNSATPIKKLIINAALGSAITTRHKK